MTRTRFVILMLVAALVAAACVDDVIIMGDTSSQVCGVGQCDTLEATVSSIDWLGDGTPPDKAISLYGVDPRMPLRTELVYEGLDDPEGRWQQTMARLRDAGFSIPVNAWSAGGKGEGKEWSIRGLERGPDTSLLLEVAVEIVDDDARAAEILAPIVDALGTIP